MKELRLENMTKASEEVEVRKAKDLEEKRAQLTQRVYDILKLTHQDEKTKRYFHDKYERIVYGNTEQIENIFKSTKDFYDAADRYEKHTQDVADQWNLTSDFRLLDHEKPEDNIEKFYQSINCQQNISKVNIIKINAQSHEFDMLLALEGEQFLKDKGIHERLADLKLSADLSGKMFFAQLQGLLTKAEITSKIKGQKIKEVIVQNIEKFLRST